MKNLEPQQVPSPVTEDLTISNTIVLAVFTQCLSVQFLVSMCTRADYMRLSVVTVVQINISQRIPVRP